MVDEVKLSPPFGNLMLATIHVPVTALRLISCRALLRLLSQIYVVPMCLHFKHGTEAGHQ